MIRQARTHMLRLRNLSARTLKTASEAVRDHTRVVDAIANGDAERAAQSLKSHIEQNVDYMGRLRDEYPDYFGTRLH
jgi:DNA-binding GntR family transcriptional regulator